MLVLQEIRRRARHLIGPLLGAGLVVYFAYHTVQGDRGLIAWWRLRHEIHQAEETLARVEDSRRQIEHRAALLRPDRLDRDMLEERARFMLDMGRDDELVVFLPTPPVR